MPDPTLRLKYYRETGQTELAKKYEQYLRETGQMGDDTVEVNAGFPERLATTILEGTQVLPGMKSFQALAGSIGSKFTDHPVSYSDARAGLEEQTDRMHPAARIGAKVAAAPMLLPAMAAAGIGGLSGAAQGAIVGGADQALDIDPNRSLGEHALRTGFGAAAGGVLGGATDRAVTIARASRPVKAAGRLADVIAGKAREAMAPPVKAAGRLADVIAGKAREAMAPRTPALAIPQSVPVPSPPASVAAPVPAPATAQPLTNAAEPEFAGLSLDGRLKALLAKSKAALPEGEQSATHQFGDAEYAMGVAQNRTADLEDLLRASVRAKGGIPAPKERPPLKLDPATERAALDPSGAAYLEKMFQGPDELAVARRTELLQKNGVVPLSRLRNNASPIAPAERENLDNALSSDLDQLAGQSAAGQRRGLLDEVGAAPIRLPIPGRGRNLELLRGGKQTPDALKVAGRVGPQLRTLDQQLDTNWPSILRAAGISAISP